MHTVFSPVHPKIVLDKVKFGNNLGNLWVQYLWTVVKNHGENNRNGGFDLILIAFDTNCFFLTL